MARKRIWYKSGYKYQLAGDYIDQVAVRPEEDIRSTTGFIDLKMDGTITVHRGYAWDGPSGPTLDTKDFMRGSLVHDALYQLMREGLLSPVTWRLVADEELRRICIEDGMPAIRAAWVYDALRLAGGQAADPHHDHAPVSAP